MSAINIQGGARSFSVYVYRIQNLESQSHKVPGEQGAKVKALMVYYIAKYRGVIATKNQTT